MKLRIVGMAIAISAVAFAGYLVGEVSAMRSLSKDAASQIAGSIFSPSSADNPMMSSEVRAGLDRQNKTFGTPKSYKIIDVLQGPFGLPAVVRVKVARGDTLHNEAVILNGLTYIEDYYDESQRERVDPVNRINRRPSKPNRQRADFHWIGLGTYQSASSVKYG
jgi:hypothetical protein